MPQELHYLRESASQTAGPYVHIGLAPGAAGFDIYREELGRDIAGPNAKGQRIRVEGLVIDGTGSPVKDVLLEVWQANAGGRYRHRKEGYLAPLDPDFGGCGRCITDDRGRYEFRTIQPGPYPWPNGPNDWRPAHIHFSVFGQSWGQRLITQMYFPGDPLFALDPIYQSITDRKARDRLIANYDHDVTTHEWATGYRWDIILTGATRTPTEDPHRGSEH